MRFARLPQCAACYHHTRSAWSSNCIDHAPGWCLRCCYELLLTLLLCVCAATCCRACAGACYANMGNAELARVNLYELLARPVEDEQGETYQVCYALCFPKQTKLVDLQTDTPSPGMHTAFHQGRPIGGPPASVGMLRRACLTAASADT
jgi:hypothetical protein